MAAPPELLDLNSPGLFRGYDTRSIERGIRYAAEARVDVVEVGPGYASGEVQGTARLPYEVEVQWAGGVVIADECSCPLGSDCKHAVALIVTIARANSVAAVRQGARPPRRGAEVIPLHAHRDPAGRGSLPARLPAPTRDWREAFAKVAVAGSTGAVPLALQFTLPVPSTSRYAAYAPPAPRILVRPMRMGAKGRWVKTGASWRDLDSPYHGYQLRDVEPAHLVAARAMGASVSGGLYSAGSDAIPLDRFGAGVWTALRHALDAGVHLIGDDRHGCSIGLATEPAHLAVDLTTDATGDGGILIHTGFVHAGQPVELSPGRAGTIGSPPHGLYIADATHIELVPLTEQIHEGLAPLLGSAPVLVPAADVDEFLDEYRPQLARAATVTSSDGSVTDQALELDGLVALVEHHAVDSARLRWAVRYRRGERVTDYLLWDPFGAARDRAAERSLVDSLELPTEVLEHLVGPSGHPADLSVHGAQAVTLLTEVVPWLEERGQVVVETTGDAPELRHAVGDPLIALDVHDPDDTDERNDWFDLSVEVSIDGEPIEFAHLFSALALDEDVLVLPSGTWLRLDRPELERLRELIGEARGLTDPEGRDAIRVNRFQTSWWDELAGLGVLRSQSERWARNVARLGALSAPEHVEVPSGLKASLRPYQQHGFDWLAFLHANELGGILADDMGLGKTVQTLALFLHVLERRPDARFLVVAPTSVVSNWHREAAQFAPGLEVRTITETASRRGTDLAEAIGGATVAVTSYALFRLEHDQYQELDWEMLVLDEAQFVKNHRAKTYQCVRRLEATLKLAITGTPIENSLMDLWSLLSIVAPGLYPDPTRFSEVYRKPIESGRAPELLATLRRRVAPLMRRRTKGDVLTELPPKIEQTVEVDLSAKHMRLYQAQLQRQRTKVLGLVDDVERNRFEILKSLTILRQLSLDPALIDGDHDAVGSAKLDRLVEDLAQVVAEGHRALVFSTFTRFLTRAKARLDEAGIAYSYLDGRTRKRDTAISAFKDGDVPTFLISLKAGGFGLNLTEADYCFVLDPWWNPAAETQAVDRAHRIGQRNPVVVYRYVSTGTIEEKVMELKERKSALFSSVMDGDEVLSGALGADDIRALIE
jgi:superfamily II DNA or RNA helicase